MFHSDNCALARVSDLSSNTIIGVQVDSCVQKYWSGHSFFQPILQ